MSNFLSPFPLLVTAPDSRATCGSGCGQFWFACEGLCAHAPAPPQDVLQPLPCIPADHLGVERTLGITTAPYFLMSSSKAASLMMWALTPLPAAARSPSS